MVSKVLIALHYNPTAQKVAEVGLLVAKSMNAVVTLLHVITDPVFYSTAGYSSIMGFNGYMDIASSQIDTATGKLNRFAPAFHGKLGYDRQLNNDLRFRITGSFYVDKSAAGNSLFFGDRTGSRYFYVMENTTATANDNAWSGRYNPQFSEQVTTFMLNPFFKYKGLELSGTYEIAKGRMITEVDMRTAKQYAVDLIYRFPQEKENFWIGGRFNSLVASLPLSTGDITINRTAGSLGWFVTKNMMLKAEYVSQLYKNFKSTDIRSAGKFDGFMIEASIGF